MGDHAQKLKRKEKKIEEHGENITVYRNIINLPLLQKYLGIYQFLGTQVFHCTQVPQTLVPKKWEISKYF